MDCTQGNPLAVYDALVSGNNPRFTLHFGSLDGDLHTEVRRGEAMINGERWTTALLIIDNDEDSPWRTGFDMNLPIPLQNKNAYFYIESAVALLHELGHVYNVPYNHTAGYLELGWSAIGPDGTPELSGENNRLIYEQCVKPYFSPRRTLCV